MVPAHLHRADLRHSRGTLRLTQQQPGACVRHVHQGFQGPPTRCKPVRSSLLRTSSPRCRACRRSCPASSGKRRSRSWRVGNGEASKRLSRALLISCGFEIDPMAHPGAVLSGFACTGVTYHRIAVIGATPRTPPGRRSRAFTSTTNSNACAAGWQVAVEPQAWAVFATLTLVAMATWPRDTAADAVHGAIAGGVQGMPGTLNALLFTGNTHEGDATCPRQHSSIYGVTIQQRILHVMAPGRTSARYA